MLICANNEKGNMKELLNISTAEIELLLPDLIKLMNKAGEAILNIYKWDITVTTKTDNTPVTQADILSSQIISKGLKTLTPGIIIISEEEVLLPYSLRKTHKYLWLLDPLDGTKEFINRNDEFSVCLALIENGRPIFGIIYVPVTHEYYYGLKGKGSFKINAIGESIKLPVNDLNHSDVVNVVISKSHRSLQDDEYIDKLKKSEKKVETIAIGSALKFGRLAEGIADVYPKFGTTMEWDIAAGQIILEECGGNICTTDGSEPLIYNKMDLHNPFFIAKGASFVI